MMSPFGLATFARSMADMALDFGPVDISNGNKDLSVHILCAAGWILKAHSAAPHHLQQAEETGVSHREEYSADSNLETQGRVQTQS